MKWPVIVADNGCRTFGATDGVIHHRVAIKFSLIFHAQSTAPIQALEQLFRVNVHRIFSGAFAYF